MNNTTQKHDLLHHLSPMSDWKGIENEGGRTIITKGEGISVWDINGKRYLDGMSGLWCVNLGYSCQPIKDAITEQLHELPYYNSFFKTSNLPTAQLSQMLSEITPPQINHFFYGCSGSDANDTIFKLVRRYWKNQECPHKKIFISRKNAYHGSTLLSATLGGMDPMHQLNDIVFPDIVHIDQPYTFDAGKPYNDQEFGLAMAKQLEDKILEIGAERVAAFIGEPIQGAGGVIIPPDSYWPEVQRICKKHGVLLVSDEVICGFARTGTWFGCEQWSIQPDLMTMAKGITSGYIPLSAVGVSDEVYQTLIKENKEFSHGYTYSAHPIASRAGVATLQYYREQKILDYVHHDLAPYFHQKTKSLQDHPLLGEIRYRGMLMAFELVKNKTTRERFQEDIGTICRDICFKKGLIMRACRHTMVLAPPLVSTPAEIDEMFQLIKEVFKETLAISSTID